MKLLSLIGMLTILGAVVIVVLIYTGVLSVKVTKDNKEGFAPHLKKIKTNTCPNYITPHKFKTGFFNNSGRFLSANNCLKKPSGYSINQPYVDYGIPKISSDCLCTEFIQPP